MDVVVIVVSLRVSYRSLGSLCGRGGDCGVVDSGVSGGNGGVLACLGSVVSVDIGMDDNSEVGVDTVVVYIVYIYIYNSNIIVYIIYIVIILKWFWC